MNALLLSDNVNDRRLKCGKCSFPINAIVNMYQFPIFYDVELCFNIITWVEGRVIATILCSFLGEYRMHRMGYHISEMISEICYVGDILRSIMTESLYCMQISNSDRILHNTLVFFVFLLYQAPWRILFLYCFLPPSSISHQVADDKISTKVLAKEYSTRAAPTSLVTGPLFTKRTGVLP